MGNSGASSSDTKPIQTNNLALTPQPMTAALIFRRQLVRPRVLNLQQALSASKLPLEKFHRLLDLAFWVKFLKFNSISLFVFLWDVYRVSPGITGYHRVSPRITGYHRVSPRITVYHSTRLFLTLRICGAPITRSGGRATLSCSPRPTITDRKTKINLMIATLKQPLDVLCKSICCLSFSNFIFFECVAIIKSGLI